MYAVDDVKLNEDGFAFGLRKGKKKEKKRIPNDAFENEYKQIMAKNVFEQPITHR